MGVGGGGGGGSVVYVVPVCQTLSTPACNPLLSRGSAANQLMGDRGVPAGRDQAHEGAAAAPCSFTIIMDVRDPAMLVYHTGTVVRCSKGGSACPHANRESCPLAPLRRVPFP